MRRIIITIHSADDDRSVAASVLNHALEVSGANIENTDMSDPALIVIRAVMNDEDFERIESILAPYSFEIEDGDDVD